MDAERYLRFLHEDIRECAFAGPYRVTDACTGCGACAETCPHNAIGRSA